MRKELIVFASGKPVKVIIRNYTIEDVDGLIDIQKACFPPPFPSELWWREDQLREHVARFPDGAICAEAEGQLIGSMTSLLLREDSLTGYHSWESITDGGYIRNHDPLGDTLYVVDLAVIPAFRKSGIGRWLMSSLYELVVHLRLKRLLGGGRMPGYALAAGEKSAVQYLKDVTAGINNDPVISFLLRCGRMPVGVMENYLDDEESCHYAALMEWRNPFLSPNQERVE
ncbi:GNAT family N-acetyltransferase [Paenibacillus nasutitermitis]|uniref:N-acetyltransferase YkwB n=1 Tax=Paenibacillus nasutitermitis TaxID=1652958 RepID=A0A917DRR4_9BACL|nr:GNAT family N-acetyltransferase [Paenibacillus nasutitermitis]GGD63755.1 putative N-acetyltransferase YkwB [Paenibacillus nasutitermitis]